MEDIRETMIQDIEGLFPADSQYFETRQIGIQLLEKAKREANNWRDLPDNIIKRYWELCVAEEIMQRKNSKIKLL